MSEPKQFLNQNELSLSIGDLKGLIGVSQLIETELEPLYRVYQSKKTKLEQEYNLLVPQVNEAQNSHSQNLKAQPRMKSTSTAFLWNREGFTPIPSVVYASETHLEHSPQQESQQPDLEQEPVPTHEALNTENHNSDDLSCTSDSLVNQAINDQLKPIAHSSSVHEEVDSSLTNVEEEPFVPFVERLQQSQALGQQTHEREEPDSSIPHSLDEIYSVNDDELISSAQGSSAAKPLSLISKTSDPELHAALAPASLRQYRRTPWQKMILVCLICLGFGGLFAYLYLYELASFMK
ncbi:MAG: hypothetical protein CMH49_07950 [Myxococcales bacterium]|nr:hypothetical protein [Myxococcales bacterium]